MNPFQMNKFYRQHFILLAIDMTVVIMTLFIIMGVMTHFKSLQTDWPHAAIAIFLLALWMIVTVIMEKFNIRECLPLRKILKRILTCNLIILSITAIPVILINDMHISLFLLLGSFLFITLIEFLLGLAIYNIQHSHFLQEWFGPEMFTTIKTNGMIPPRNLKQKRFPKVPQELLDYITEIVGREACDWLCTNVRLGNTKTLLIDTCSRFNLSKLSDDHLEEVVNLQLINNHRRINKFFETVNAKLAQGGIFIGCGETYLLRKKKLLQTYPPVLNYFIYVLDVIYRRIMPKLTLTRKLYFLLSGGKNRGFSRAEMLGRIVSCGFEILEEQPIGDLLFVKARKIRDPFYDQDPSYGTLVRLRRVGKNGSQFNVFKFRTMHAYSEYLQEYVHSKNNLARGGKFENDFRLIGAGRFMRRYWIDEIPMLINLVRGDIKLVGVRPISMHYFRLYSETLQQERIRCKPGLIPPYYAQFPVPQTLEEIEQNELEYLRHYAKHPIRTDFIYFHRVVYNILFRCARSK